jgi:hypothetical protein
MRFKELHLRKPQQWTGAVTAAALVWSFCDGTIRKNHHEMLHTETSAYQLEPTAVSGYALGTATASVTMLTLRGH